MTLDWMLWVWVATIALSTIGKILLIGETVKYTRGWVAVDVIVNSLFIAWLVTR